jgi:hypothetical protein
VPAVLLRAALLGDLCHHLGRALQGQEQGRELHLDVVVRHQVTPLGLPRTLRDDHIRSYQVGPTSNSGSSARAWPAATNSSMSATVIRPGSPGPGDAPAER